MERIYNEDGHEISEAEVDPDKGHLVHDTITIHHPKVDEVQEVSHQEVVNTYYEQDPTTGEDLIDPKTGQKIVRGQEVKTVIDTPYVPPSDAWDETQDILRYKLYTPEELDALAKGRAALAIQEAQQMQAGKLAELTASSLIRSAPDSAIADISTYVPKFDPEQSYSAKDCVIFNGVPYRALASVRAGSSTDPSKETSMWKRIGTPVENGIYPWIQPSSAEDAYSKGDKVEFEGDIYISDIEYNVWSPSVHGWTVDSSVHSDKPVDPYPDWTQPIGATTAYRKGAKVTYDGKHYISTLDNNVWKPTVYGWDVEE